MSKATLIKRVLVVISILIGVWLIYFEAIVPFVAKANIPLRWQNIPLGEKQKVVFEYLGRPVIESGIKGDEWKRSVKKNTVFLLVLYNSDTIADHYQIGFVYNHWFGRRTYYLKRDSI